MTPLESIRNTIAEFFENTYCVDAPDINTDKPVVVLTPYMRDDFDSSPVYWEHVQVKVSASSFPVAEKTAWIVFRIMGNSECLSANCDTLSRVLVQSVPYYLGKDEDMGRYVFTFDSRVACKY